MDCKFVERSISDYLSGELPAQEVLELEEHLQSCPGCQALHADFQRITSACRALPNFEAREELWYLLRQKLPVAAVQAREVQPRSFPEEDPISTIRQKLAFYRHVAYAAVALAIVSISLWVGQFVFQPGADPEPATAPAELAALEVRRAELHYQNAIDSLTQVLETAKADWSAEVRVVVEQNLRTIDRSIAECRAALRRDPRNLEAETYLLAAYRKKVDFLKSVLDHPVS